MLATYLKYYSGHIEYINGVDIELPDYVKVIEKTGEVCDVVIEILEYEDWKEELVNAIEKYAKKWPDVKYIDSIIVLTAENSHYYQPQFVAWLIKIALRDNMKLRGQWALKLVANKNYEVAKLLFDAGKIKISDLRPSEDNAKLYHLKSVESKLGKLMILKRFVSGKTDEDSLGQLWVLPWDLLLYVMSGRKDVKARYI